MHRAVKVDGGHCFVRVEDISDYLWILITSGTLVVDDDIITLGPVSILEEIEGGVNGLVRGPDDVDSYIGSALQAFGDDFVLLSVIVAATAGDQQGFQGLGRCLRISRFRVSCRNG